MKGYPQLRWHNIYVAGTGACFPKRESVESAIARGSFTREAFERTQQLSVTVADDEQRSPDLAIAAAREALARSGCTPADVGLLFYAVALHAGVDAWNANAYVQRHVATAQCLSAEIRSGCNAAMVAIELACTHLTMQPKQSAAVVTAADCYREPTFHRWGVAAGPLFGDGGAAIVLSGQAGFARLVSTCTTTDPEMEAMQRGDEPFGPFRHTADNPIDLVRRAHEFFRTVPRKVAKARHDAGVRAAIEGAAAQAGVDLSEFEHLVLPFDGAEALHRDYLIPFGFDIARTTYEFDRRTGHYGAGDPLGGLNYLVESRRLSAGDRVLVVGEGGGFVWTAAVLEIQEPPHVPEPGERLSHAPVDRFTTTEG